MCCSTDQGNYLGNNASSIYNALQVKLDRRFSHGLQLLSHYTFAHANKYDSNYYADNHAIAYGPDDQVRNHVWVTEAVYELPFGKGKIVCRKFWQSRRPYRRGLADYGHHKLEQRVPVDSELQRMQQRAGCRCVPPE